jgi:uncharacterized protein YciI
MKFAAVVHFKADDPRLPEFRPAHRQYLATLFEQGKLVLSGPFTEGGGALIVLETATKDDAEAILRADPFTQAGVFTSWDMHPWNILFAKKELLPDPAR